MPVRGWRSLAAPPTWHALILIAVAATLRLLDLGRLGLYGDEDISAVAVNSLLRDGAPQMPSGLVYLRGLPYTLAAAACRLFTHDLELGLRLPSALAGVAAVGIVYGLARGVASRGAALFTAWLLAVSTWHVDLSREGRMYSMFLAAFLLGVWIFDRWVRDGKPRDLAIAGGAALLTVLLHELGVLLFFVWAVILYARRARRRTLVAAAALTAGLGILWAVGQVQFRLELRHVGVAAPTADSVSLLRNILHLHHHPAFLLLRTAWEGYRGPYLLLATAGFAATLWGAARGGPDPGSGRTRAIHAMAIAIVVAAATLSLFGLVGALLLAMAVLRPRETWSAARSSGVRVGAWVAGGWLGLWLLFAAVERSWIADAGAATSGRALVALVKDLFGYPAPHVLVFFDAMPLMTAAILAGTLWMLGRGLAAGERAPETTIVLAWLWLPLLLTGFTDPWIALRYALPLYPAFLILFATTVVAGAAAIGRALDRSRRDGPAARALPWAAGAVLLLASPPREGHALGAAWRTATLDYRDPISAEIHGFPFHPDHESAGRWVRTNARPEDAVVAEDELTQTIYAGRVDYWLRSRTDARFFSYLEKGTLRSFYTRLPVLDSVSALDSLLAAPRPGAVWVVTSGELTDRLAPLRPRGLQRYLDARPDALVYTARDDSTRVYRFAREGAR